MPPAWAAPVVDAWPDALGLAAVLGPGLALITPVMPAPAPPCAREPPPNPPPDTPRAIAGAAIERGAITARGMELNRATRTWAGDAVGARTTAGADRLIMADSLVRATACVDGPTGAAKLGEGAAAARTFPPA
jgi:hypothetical protein